MDTRSLALGLLTLVTPTFAGAAAAATAPAGPSIPSAADVRSSPTETEWYVGKLVLADAATLTMTVAAGRAVGGAGILTGLATWVSFAPVIHLFEVGPGRAAGSLGLRLVMPVAGGFIAGWLHERGRSSEDGCDCMGGIFAAFGGATLGMLTAMITDYLAFGHKQVARAPLTTAADRRPPRRQALRWTPTVALGPRNAGLGVVGEF